MASPAVLAEGVPVITLDAWMAKRMGLCEPLRRPALSAWQAARLSEVVAYARANSPFYRAQSNWPDVEIRCPEDIRGLPFTTAADLARNVPPLLALPQSAVRPIITVAVSGGSGPLKRVHFTEEDREATIDFFTHGMSLLTKNGDRVAIAFPDGRVGGFADSLAVALVAERHGDAAASLICALATSISCLRASILVRLPCASLSTDSLSVTRDRATS